MTKTDLDKAVQNTKQNIKDCLQIVYDALNQGQQKQIVKNEKVKELFDLYGVNYK